MNWNKRRVLVTGGASFIGSHLVDALVARGARVRVVDDLTSGKRANLQEHLDAGRVEFLEADLLDAGVADRAVEGMDTVFHLAARHGGRGYIETHEVACSENFALDGLVFRACRLGGVGQIVYASSGCIYPLEIQTDPSEELYLREDMAGPPSNADHLYGWAKLMAEMTLTTLAREAGIRTASLRYFTVYGERGKEDHAVMAMISRAFIGEDPFEVWGTGEQIRNWTYVGDIVEGTILAAERIEDGTAINLGTTERIRVIDAAREVLRRFGHDAVIRLLPDMPTGPLNRTADNALAKELLGWSPRYNFTEGLERTIAWYREAHDVDEVRERLPRSLLDHT